MRLLFATGFWGTLLICWLPGGLIHQGQKEVNPKAVPALAQLDGTTKQEPQP
jgi:hypothetical protein